MTMKMSNEDKPIWGAYVQQRDRLFFMSTAGFSLVELLVAAAILAATITGMLQLFVQTSVLTDMAHNQTLAIHQAENIIEDIREYDFDNVLNDYSSAGTIGNTFTLSDLDGSGLIGVGTVDADGDLLAVDVTVNWDNKYGRDDTFTLQTMVTRR